MNDDIKIEDELYKAEDSEIKPDKLINETKIISKELDGEFVDKVRRIVIKGQLDGN